MNEHTEKEFERIGRQENSRDPLVVAKFHCPSSSAAWYATEYEPETGNFFGYVSGLAKNGDEWGYFGLDELASIRIPVDIVFHDKATNKSSHIRSFARIERDRHFTPKRISEVIPDFYRG